jgi:hypothetical protein
MGLVAPFTGLAWAPAILTGMIIGRADVDRSLGRPVQGMAVRILGVTGGVLAMAFFSALLGLFAGIVAFVLAFLIAAGAAYSERIAANASPTDRTMSRLVISVATVIVWLVLFFVIRPNINLSFGSRPLG